MVDPTERLIQRILMALLGGPLPLRRFGNAFQKKAIAEARHRRLVRVHPTKTEVSLTTDGHHQASRWHDAREMRRKRRRKDTREPTR